MRTIFILYGTLARDNAVSRSLQERRRTGGSLPPTEGD